MRGPASSERRGPGTIEPASWPCLKSPLCWFSSPSMGSLHFPSLLSFRLGDLASGLSLRRAAEAPTVHLRSPPTQAVSCRRRRSASPPWLEQILIVWGIPDGVADWLAYVVVFSVITCLSHCPPGMASTSPLEFGHDHTLALWRLSDLDGLPTLQWTGARDIRWLRQNRLSALSSCSISVAMWGCEGPRAPSNRQDREAPDYPAGPLLQAEGDALAYIPSPLWPLRSSRCSVECRARACCPESRASIWAGMT